MSENNQSSNSLDIIGIGQVMKAIPNSALERIVDTSCNTFEQVVSPITAITSGTSQVIQETFNLLTGVQKIWAKEIIENARRKVKQSKYPEKMAKAKIILQVIENGGKEADASIRHLWSNLLAQEIISGSVHREVGRILSRLNAEDAQLLAIIAERKSRISPFLSDDPSITMDKTTFNHEHLKNLNLIEKQQLRWYISTFGQNFIKAVSDPSQKHNDNINRSNF